MNVVSNGLVLHSLIFYFLMHHSELCRQLVIQILRVTQYQLCFSLICASFNPNLCLFVFVPAGRLCHSYISLCDVVDPPDQRSDAARSIRRHQILPLPRHFTSL